MMPDREKVIKGLEFTKAMITFNPSTGEDIEPENLNEADKTTYDACVGAIALLKEQEATMVIESENMYTGLPITHCPKCGISLDKYLYGRQYEGQINYCPMCGQAVKWE